MFNLKLMQMNGPEVEKFIKEIVPDENVDHITYLNSIILERITSAQNFYGVGMMSQESQIFKPALNPMTESKNREYLINSMDELYRLELEYMAKAKKIIEANTPKDSEPKP